jgi:hypothetical protein
MKSLKKKLSIKQLLLSNKNWWHFYEKNKQRLRKSITVSITKLLSCKHKVRGYYQYECFNPNCLHQKHVIFTCKSKACSSCGKKLTAQWLKKQYQILPNIPYQHITLTMPSELWDFFWCNRSLLNEIAKKAAKCIQKIAAKKNVTPGLFIAIHTFGRNMKRNVHIHLSTTTAGITKDGTQLKNLYFNQNTIMKMWRYEVIQLFRKASLTRDFTIPVKLKNDFNHSFSFNNFLDKLYKINWIVHCAQPDENYKRIINYLGSYMKRPPIAESKLRHYDGNNISFTYFDHKSKTFLKFKLTVEEFIARFITHIPDIGFRMIRYYGFLSNRLRGTLLPLVHKLLGSYYQKDTVSPSFAEIMFKDFGVNPLECVLCGEPLRLTATHFGKTSVPELLAVHRQLALLKNI